ncbi:hypothetical protein J2Z21_000712 [Streptomyces griseochromogenes]|uniref:Uncharacterized protein n=1 Tax=Streptomyces griseochromogenes TaxID=68214 RepID=A0ABS4LK74_9ACTN|nr:hypothetical protein [Streptomyces griseochromogenes]
MILPCVASAIAGADVQTAVYEDETTNGVTSLGKPSVTA